MPRIPDVTDVSARRIPRTAGGIVRDRSGEMIGAALEDAGDTLMRVQEREREADSRLEIAQAKRDVLIADSEITSALDSDPDWASHDKKYSDAMAKARESAAQRITDGNARELFMVDTDLTVARGRESVRNRARNIEVSSGRKAVASDIDALVDGALRSTDERVRAEMLRAIGERVDAVSEGDPQNPGKGYLSNGEAMEIKKAAGERYALARLEGMDLRSRVAALESPEGTPAALLSEPERIQRLNHEKDRLRIEEDRARREAEMDARIRRAEARDELRDAESDAFAAKSYGLDSMLPPRSLYLAAYGDDGAERYEQSARMFSVYDAVSTAVTLPPDKAAEMIEAYKPTDQEGAAEQRKAYTTAVNLYRQERAKLVDDPAGGIIARDLDLRKLYDAAIDGDSAAAGDYVAKVRAKASAMGLPRAILPKSAADSLSLQLSFDPDKPGRRSEVLQGLREQWGQYYPQIIREISPKLEGDARIIANMAPEAARHYDTVLAQGRGEIMERLSTDKKAAVKNAGAGVIEPLAETLASNPDAESRINEHVDAVQLLAASMVNRNTDPETAAERAFNMVIGDRYSFRGSMRIPRQFDADLIERSANSVRLGIKPSELAVKPSPFGTVEQGQKDLRALIASDGAWFTTADESGLELRVPVLGKMMPVVDTSGQRIRYTWKELQDLPPQGREYMPYEEGAR
ncbi:MAG: hypothetical protein AB7F22_17755 [Reyranella sp.]|uniref:hypothetical protein n=1 Tax=Reyranella sp. TaxID=1929291 RepID=UPI003D0AF158